MKRAFFPLLFAAIAASRFCHLNILWTEEDLPLAAAVQMLRGKTLYGGVWYDKPPLVPSICMLGGAKIGWPLRLAGTLFVFLACVLAWRFARDLWGEREGRLAAALLAFFLIFGIPSAVLPLAADSLMVAPHLAAVHLAWRGRPFWSGVLAGIGLLLNAKALIVLAACALFQYRALPWLAAGFLAPNAIAIGYFWAQGALGDYYEQVWWLGSVYARSTFLENPIRAGLARTANWMGFQAALVVGAAIFWIRERKPERWRLAVWAALSLAAVAAGWRFFPRYYFALLPVMALGAARGWALLGGRRAAVLLSLLLLPPLVRFGPRYLELARDLAARSPHEWSDIAMDQDSRAASAEILRLARPGNTLFVWGYRPDIYVYTRLPAASRFLESQPLDGVFADRHLTSTDAVEPAWTMRNRAEVVHTHPTFIVDGLSLFNPKLSMKNWPELRGWLHDYRLVGRTPETLIFQITGSASTGLSSPETPRSLPGHPR